MKKYINFSDLTLQKKVIFVIIGVCLVIQFGNAIILKTICAAYDEQLYIKNTQVFSSYVERIETEFVKLDADTLSFIGEETVQNYMMLLRDDVQGSAEWIEARKSLRTKTSNIKYNYSFLDALGIYTCSNFLIGEMDLLHDMNMDALQQMASEYHGASTIVWYGNQLLYLRQIRQTKDYIFSNMGTIIGVINLDKVIQNCGKIYEDNGVRIGMSLFIDNDCIYRDGVELDLLAQDGWEIQGDYFVVQNNTKRDWKFLTYTPYKEIQKSITQTLTRSIILTVIITLLAIFGSSVITKKIASEFKQLSIKIDNYARGILPNRDEISRYESRKDEIGWLNRRFDSMAYKNQRLNEKNYQNMVLQKDTEYKLLQQQIQPHFIFNTLLLITWMSYEQGYKELAELSTALSRLVRNSISMNQESSTVEKEATIVNDYMKIQLKRYGERLSFDMNLPEEIMQIKIPHMTIQPIVENSIKYALEEMLEPCEIKVYGNIVSEKAVIIVEDNGTGIEEDILYKLTNGQIKPKGTGIGLQNIHKRIRLAYSNQYGLEFHRENNHTQVWIVLPVKM